MKQKIKALWQTCFNDTEEFIELYFTHRYRDDITMTIEAERQIIASLQMIPYPMTFCDTIINTSYISGACTHPDFRNQGVMNTLLQKSIRTMWEKGELITTLIPAEKWLFDYYGKFGYATTFFYSTSTPFLKENPQKGNFIIEKLCSTDLDAYQYFNNNMLMRPYCIQHTEEDFSVILEDIRLSKGEILVVKDDKPEIKGILFYTPEEDKIIIKEIITDGEVYQDRLLTEIMKTFGEKPIEIIHFPDSTTMKELGMARLVNVPELLRIYAKKYPDLCISFQLSDPIIEENNGYYHLEHGICIHSIKPLKDIYQTITIAQLTALILLGKNEDSTKGLSPFPVHFPYMSLMLN